MTSFKDRIKAAAHEDRGGFRPHPIGTFPGEITDVSQKTTPRGTDVYEVHVSTPQGKTKMSLWHNTYDNTVAIAPAGEEPAAEEKYIKHMARVCRLYSDLGLGEPDGEDHLAIEADAYGRLGELIGQACTVVVKAKEGDPQNPWVFVNAPGGAVERTAAGSKVTRLAGPTSAFSGVAPDDVPF